MKQNALYKISQCEFLFIKNNTIQSESDTQLTFILSQVTPRQLLWSRSNLHPINCSSEAISNDSTLPPKSLTVSSFYHPTLTSLSFPEQKLIWMIYYSFSLMITSTLVIFFNGSNVCLSSAASDPAWHYSPLVRNKPIELLEFHSTLCMASFRQSLKVMSPILIMSGIYNKLFTSFLFFDMIYQLKAIDLIIMHFASTCKAFNVEIQVSATSAVVSRMPCSANTTSQLMR